jgi:hypothetical protein
VYVIGAPDSACPIGGCDPNVLGVFAWVIIALAIGLLIRAGWLRWRRRTRR